MDRDNEQYRQQAFRAAPAPEPVMPGADLPEPQVKSLEVSQKGDGIFSSFTLAYQGSEPSKFQAYLDPESLKIDRIVQGSDVFPVAHEHAVDRQIQQQCQAQGIEAPIKLEAAQQWVAKNIGGDFEILKGKFGYQLQGAGGIWTKQENIRGIFDRIENRLVDDLHFLKDVGKAIGYPENLRNDRGELDYRHSAYVRSKIEAAMETRPDCINQYFSEQNERETPQASENRSMKM